MFSDGNAISGSINKNVSKNTVLKVLTGTASVVSIVGLLLWFFVKEDYLSQIQNMLPQQVTQLLQDTQSTQDTQSVQRKKSPMGSIYAIQQSVEKFLIEKFEYPSSISELELDQESIYGITASLLPEGVIEVMIAGMPEVLVYKPSFENGALYWSCEPVAQSTGSAPIECQDLDSWKRNSNKIYSSDKLTSIFLPNDWIKQENIDEMSLFYLSEDKNSAIAIVSELKSDFEAISYGTYANRTFSALSQSLENGEFLVCQILDA